MSQLSLFDCAPPSDRPQEWPGGEDQSALLTAPDMLASWPQRSCESLRRWHMFGDELSILYLVDSDRGGPSRIGIPALGLVLEGRFDEIRRQALAHFEQLAGELLRRDPGELKQTVTVAWKDEVRPYVFRKKERI